MMAFDEEKHPLQNINTQKKQREQTQNNGIDRRRLIPKNLRFGRYHRKHKITLFVKYVLVRLAHQRTHALGFDGK